MNGNKPLLESIDEVMARADPKWLIRHILPVPGLTLLYGPSGQGKSFIALDWSLSIAGGIPWLGRYPVDTAGAVIYIACEGTGGLKRRISAWKKQHPDAADLTSMTFALQTLNLYEEDERQALLDALDDHYEVPEDEFEDEEGMAISLRVPLRLVVVDTVARVFQGEDENDNAQMSDFIRAIEEFATLRGAAVVLVHHSAKANARNERGGGALRGAMDACYACSGKTKGGKLSDVSLVCNKMKDSDERTVEMEMVEHDLPELSLDEDGAIRHGGALVLVEEGTREEDEADNDANNGAGDPEPELALLAVLRRFPEGLTTSEWNSEADLTRPTFNRYRVKLLEDKRVEKGHDGRWNLVSRRVSGRWA